MDCKFPFSWCHGVSGWNCWNVIVLLYCSWKSSCAVFMGKFKASFIKQSTICGQQKSNLAMIQQQTAYTYISTTVALLHTDPQTGRFSRPCLVSQTQSHRIAALCLCWSCRKLGRWDWSWTQYICSRCSISKCSLQLVEESAVFSLFVVVVWLSACFMFTTRQIKIIFLSGPLQSTTFVCYNTVYCAEVKHCK